MQRKNVRVVAHQAPVDDLGLRVCIRLEVDETEKVQNIGIIGPELLSTLELLPRLSEASFVKSLASTVAVEKKNALIEWSGERWRRIAIGHCGRDSICYCEPR